MIQPQARNAWSHWERKEAGKDDFLEPLGGAWPCQHLSFRLLAPRAVRE